MKTKTIITTLFVALAVAIGVTSVTLFRVQDASPQAAATQQDVNGTAEQTANIVKFTAESDKNILEQLASHAAIQTKTSQFGTYVDAINGKHGGEEGKYWTFYVDGQMSQIGAEAYVTKGGEVIEWKFE